MRCTVRVPIPSDLVTFDALRKPLSHLPFGHAVYLRAAELYPLCYGAIEA
jgi:hypothetical protein